jgi:hypothetical protein
VFEHTANASDGITVCKALLEKHEPQCEYIDD